MLLMAIILCAATGQSQVRIGLKGGLNITEMSFDSKVFDSANRSGFFAGPILKVGLPLLPIGFDIAAVYDQRMSKIESENMKQESIHVPVNMRLEVGLGSLAGIYLSAGPQFGFNIGKEMYTWESLTANKERVENTFQLKKSTMSFNMGAGVRIKGIEVGFTYNVAVGKTANFDSMDTVVDELYESYNAHTNAWQLNAAIFF